MKYDYIYSEAVDLITAKKDDGTKFFSKDTLCVAVTEDEKLYSAFNKTEYAEGKLVTGSSEKEVLKKISGGGNSRIAAMITMNCIDMVPVLPDQEAVDEILKLDKYNATTDVVSPNFKYIKIKDLGEYKPDGDNSSIEILKVDITAKRSNKEKLMSFAADFESSPEDDAPKSETKFLFAMPKHDEPAQAPNQPPQQQMPPEGQMMPGQAPFFTMDDVVHQYQPVDGRHKGINASQVNRSKMSVQLSQNASQQFMSQGMMNGQYGQQSVMMGQFGAPDMANGQQSVMLGQFGNQGMMNGQYGQQSVMLGQFGDQNNANAQNMNGQNMNGQYMQQQGMMNNQYGAQNMNGQYMQQGMMNNQYGAQNMNGQYMQQGMMNNQYGGQNMNGQYMQQGMMNNQYGGQNMNGQYMQQGMMNNPYGGQGMMNGQYMQQGMMNNPYGGQNMMNGQYMQQGMMNNPYGGQNMMNGQYMQQQGMMNNQYGGQNMMNGQYMQQQEETAPQNPVQDDNNKK